MSDLIFLDPVFHEKIWGGRKLETDWGYDIPAGPVGECWGISAHPNGDCKVTEGEFEGLYLSELWETHRELFGGLEGKEFPLLVKIIDAMGDLSIQVHPDDAYAAEHEHGSLGKRECWYVLSAEPGATIVVGQRAHDRAEFSRMVEEGRWSDLLNEIPIHAGDFFQIDPGTVHAIKAGTVVLETQQSSDVTYRVYDYDRIQADGTKRDLHMAQSLDVIDYAATPLSSGTITAPEVDGICELERCDTYTVDRVRVSGPRTLPAPERFLCVSVIEGDGAACGAAVGKGSHFIVPAGLDLFLEGEMTLVTSHV
jgi:mannose-6-phosphate isomerase